MESDGRFKDFLRSKWFSYEVEGEGMFVFKEKLNKLKLDLRIWNKEVFGNVNQIGEELQKKMQELDARDEESELDEQGMEERRFLLAEQSRNNFKQEVVM